MTKDNNKTSAFYSPLSPYASGFLEVDEIHTLYWEQSGNPDGVPIIFLHGGPGGGTHPACRQFFDPDHYRIILLDQRGCGRSTPLAEVRHNTAKHLVGDLEILRTHLQIDRWIVFGGSWGSTLGLHYATTHPDRCIGLILRGIFLCEQPEIDWFMHGMGQIFPEVWARFASLFPDDQDKLLERYYKALMSDDEAIYLPAATRWAQYESVCSTLIPVPAPPPSHEQSLHDVAIARLEAHYFIHEVIAPQDSLLNKIDAIRDIPAMIIQGRYDIICPPVTADKLHKAWPEAEYVIVPNAGHSAFDPALLSHLIDATDRFKTLDA